jgi:hypothetical protein
MKFNIFGARSLALPAKQRHIVAATNYAYLSVVNVLSTGPNVSALHSDSDCKTQRLRVPSSHPGNP